MDEEMIDIATKEGTLTGHSVPKSEVHQKGLYHHTVHLWLYNYQHQILLQQRAASKAICPLLWDVSVAGHIDAGETQLQAAVRETKEEIGLVLSESDLKKIGMFKCFQSYPNGIIDNEFHNTYIAKLKAPLNDLIPQPEEVEDLKLVTFEEFETLLKNSETNNHFVASNRDYYHFVLNAIKAILKD